jgi:hypothetical protein
MTPHQQLARIFTQNVKDQAPELRSRWVPFDRLHVIKQNGALFLPGPGLADTARQRLHVDLTHNEKKPTS